MDIIIIILLACLIILLLFNIISKKRPDQSILLMHQQIDSLRGQLNDSLSTSTSNINQQLSNITSQVNTQLSSMSQQMQNSTGQIGTRLDNAAKVVGEVRQNLGELSEATKRVFEVGKDISSLQEILRSPKLRGGLGELFLGDLLGQILPPTHFSLQYQFKTGDRVDAVIHLGQGLVPVDSKFPLENFKRLIESSSDDEKRAARKKFNSDVKKHIDTIANKYILPDEGTFDFALMYIPAENVYYETIIKDEAFGDDDAVAMYALKKKIVPVSPNSFYAYLQAILLGLKGLRIERSAQIIISQIERLKGDFERFRKEFEVIGSHLNNAVGKYQEANRRLDRFSERLVSLDEERPALAELAEPPKT